MISLQVLCLVLVHLLTRLKEQLQKMEENPASGMLTHMLEESKIKSTGDISADQYHKYKEDVKLMHETGLDAYRFSFSWSRIIPDGHGDVNPKGLSYYNNLINELVSYGIEPHVNLSQFDFPQALEDEYWGLLSPKIIGDFTMYADTCFKEFGDRVKHWMTFSEPNIQTVMGNDVGIIPPARCSYPFGFGVNCSEGDATTEPYISAHNILLSHAAAANLYKEKYQEKQRGRIGITLLACWLRYPRLSAHWYSEFLAKSRRRRKTEAIYISLQFIDS